EAGGLSDPGIEPTGGIAGATRGVRLAFIELTAIGRICEPVATVRMRDDIIRRVQLFAIIGIGEHGDGAVIFVAHHPASEMLAGKLPTLEVERVAIAVVGW